MTGHRSLLALITILTVPTLAGNGHERHRSPPEEQVHRFPPQVVELDDFDADGWVLAIGGGGESVIGQLKGTRVVAVDISRGELEDAPGDALKIVMDARDLQFLDATFDVAASFFTLMYIDGADHTKVFAEVYRVLRPGGRFLIWDASFGDRPDERVRIGLVTLTVKLPDREIQTGYGARWPDRPHDLPYYKRLAVAAGFELVEEEARGSWFRLVARKP